MDLPGVTLVRRRDTHRLVPSRHGDSVLAEVAAPGDLDAIFALDAATNDRLHAHAQRLPGIGLDELVFGVPHAQVVNAAFCHAHPLGARFNGPDRGAWYAAFDLDTSKAEVAFHKAVQLAEVRRFDDSVTYDDYLADFSASFHDLRRPVRRSAQRHGGDFRACLDPASYVASQQLAETLLETGSLGIVYPSVRHAGGTCLACFRPALVGNVRRGKTWRFTWRGTPQPVVKAERTPR
jgi:RES domain-containing protein